MLALTCGLMVTEGGAPHINVPNVLPPPIMEHRQRSETIRAPAAVATAPSIDTWRGHRPRKMHSKSSVKSGEVKYSAVESRMPDEGGAVQRTGF